MRHLRQLARTLGTLRGLGVGSAATPSLQAEQQSAVAAAEAFLNRGFPTAACIWSSNFQPVTAPAQSSGPKHVESPEAALSLGESGGMGLNTALQRHLVEQQQWHWQQQQQQQEVRGSRETFVMDPPSQAALQLQSVCGIVPFMDALPDAAVELDGGMQPIVWHADSVRRKRRSKMNKHKHRKRRKLNRHRK